MVSDSSVHYMPRGWAEYPKICARAPGSEYIGIIRNQGRESNNPRHPLHTLISALSRAFAHIDPNAPYTLQKSPRCGDFLILSHLLSQTFCFQAPELHQQAKACLFAVRD